MLKILFWIFIWVVAGLVTYSIPILLALLTSRCEVGVRQQGGVTYFDVEPLGWLEKLANGQMTPVMYLLAGTRKEAPQKTHRWNNCRWLPSAVTDALEREMLQPFEGDPDAIERRGVRFHLWRWGGWSKYVVLETV